MSSSCSTQLNSIPCNSSFEKLYATLESAAGDCSPESMNRILTNPEVKGRLVAGLEAFRKPSEASKKKIQTMKTEGSEDKTFVLKLSNMLVSGLDYDF
jgi:hypothetical protein